MYIQNGCFGAKIFVPSGKPGGDGILNRCFFFFFFSPGEDFSVPSGKLF
jgi:hypothetical protein